MRAGTRNALLPCGNVAGGGMVMTSTPESGRRAAATAARSRANRHPPKSREAGVALSADGPRLLHRPTYCARGVRPEPEGDETPPAVMHGPPSAHAEPKCVECCVDYPTLGGGGCAPYDSAAEIRSACDARSITAAGRTARCGRSACVAVGCGAPRGMASSRHAAESCLHTVLPRRD